MTALSVLDLVPVRQGHTAHEALAETAALASHAETFRQTGLDVFRGDASKAHRELGWEATTGFEELTFDMVRADTDLMERAYRLRRQS